MLVTVNPKTMNLTMLNIPRDTNFKLACTNDNERKINYANDDCIMKTLNQIFNVNIDYYVKVDFRLVVDLVDILGGIDMNVPQSICEQNSRRQWGTNVVLVEKGIKDIVYLRGIQDDIITSKYLTGVIIKDIEDEILTRMYYNYLFEKIKRLKVRNEYIKIKINGDIIKYIKGKEDNNLNKIKELYYIKEIKIQNENNNKIGKKLEIVLDNEKD